MGLIRSCFTFLMGTGCGIYMAQNYDVPDMRKLVLMGLAIGRHSEERLLWVAFLGSGRTEKGKRCFNKEQ
ncbi:hypothetical protein M5K25_023725 [Dendrobium thyrsiflorum]|uniref:Uncharacterized protein n=1 Tax=Dendrobium thyrsiflorum TaxID=117978 RepID=A0ABD0U0I8_DENTH